MRTRVVRKASATSSSRRSSGRTCFSRQRNGLAAPGQSIAQAYDELGPGDEMEVR